jgi:peptide-methionine (R)-S-oxide reductase
VFEGSCKETPGYPTDGHNHIAIERPVIMKRRGFLSQFPLVVALLGMGSAASANPKPRLIKDKAEWKRLLPAGAYQVLFEHATERPGSSSLNDEKRPGAYVCAACYLPLFDAVHKYDSGTGWPSFFQPLASALGTSKDYKLLLPRTEYHCARCGGHHGHVFDDGPRPTGLRYCNNGVALQFVPQGQPLPALRT